MLSASGSASEGKVAPSPTLVSATMSVSSAMTSSRSLRRMLSLFLFHHPKFELTINLTDSICAVWSCVSFIWESYLSESADSAAANASTLAGIEAVDFVVSLFFALNFLKEFLLASVKRNFFLSFSTWIDIATTFPNIVLFGLTVGKVSTSGADAAANISFLRFFRVLKVLRLNRVSRGSGNMKPGGLIQSQINELALTLTASLFIFAGAFQMVEQMFVSVSDDNKRRNGRLDFINSMYFTVSTVATVGYGDVVPLSVPGKGMVVVMLCFILTVVSQKLSAITLLMSKQSKYERLVYSFSAPHVIICGGIDTNHLATFLRELFHKDHQKPGQSPIRAVVVAQRDPDFEMLSVVTDPVFSDRIMYINGNLLDEDDLRRASAHTAKAMFIFCSQSSRSNLQRNDGDVLLQSMALLSFVQKLQSNMPRIIALVHFSLTMRRFNAIMNKYDSNHHQVVCLEELKPALLVQGCINPGFSGLAYSMIRSFTLTDILGVKDQSIDAMPPWQREFIDGMDYEVYSTTLSPSFYGVSFAAAAGLLHEKLHVFLIAVEVSGDTHLAPLAYLFPNSVSSVHVLAGSAHHALEVALCSPPKDFHRAHVSKEEENSSSSKKMTAMERMQFAAKKVVVESSVASALKRFSSLSTAPSEQSAPLAEAAPSFVNLKEMSSHWKKVRLAVKMSAAFGNRSAKALTKDAYSFLLQSDKNPKFARMEAKKSFLVLDEDVPFKNAKIAQYEGFDHIIFCCKCDAVPGALAGSLKRFIAPLRSKSCIFVHTPIVILTLSIHVKDFEAVAMYPGVFIVIGNPLLMQDLRRAGASTAKFAVVCSDFVPVCGDHDSQNDVSSDVDTAAMFAGNLMKKLNDTLCVVVELKHASSIKFIGASPNENHEICAATASGRFFSIQYFHILMCRCFYAPSCLSLLQEFLRPHPSFVTDSSREFSFSSSIMTSVSVPHLFVGGSFGSMFSVCTSIGIIVAVYRSKTVFNAAREKYLVCCPSSNMRVNHGDHIIILSPLPSKDVEPALAQLTTFHLWTKLEQEKCAQNWRKVYDSVDSESAIAASNSLSSESLLVQLVDTAAKKIRELRHELDHPDRSSFSDAARSLEPSSPGLRGKATLEKRGSIRRSALSSNDKDMPSGESMVAGTGRFPSRL